LSAANKLEVIRLTSQSFDTELIGDLPGALSVWKTWQIFHNLKLRQMSKNINKLISSSNFIQF